MKRLKILISEQSTYTGLAIILGGALVLDMNMAQWDMVLGGVMMLLGTPAAFTVDKADRAELEAE